ncbi:MAG: hypothetical protein HY334_08085 [Armatimonadetes bacterium]|nr:hypothetical protein [Armatimonadota bacterium]
MDESGSAQCELVVVFLITEDVDGLMPFYRDIVGLRLTRHDPGHSAWFDSGPVRLAIHQAEGIALTRPAGAESYVYFRDPEGRLLGFHQPA